LWPVCPWPRFRRPKPPLCLLVPRPDENL